MTSKLLNSPKLALAVAGGVAALLLVGGWFLLVGPKRSETKKLDTEIASVESQITQRRAELAKPKADMTVRSSDLFRLAKAMPDGTDMPGVMLDVSRLAKQHGVVFTSITPSPAVPQPTGYQVVPIQLIVEGRFGDLSGYLGDLRRLVTVRHKRLDARGRLFSIDGVSIGAADEKGFPFVKATLTMNAFAFTGVAPAPPAAPPAGAGQSEPTTPSSGTTVAAGATP